MNNIRMICFDGNLNLLKKLYLEGKLTKENVLNNRDPTDPEYLNHRYLNLFEITSYCGYLEICQWLYKTFEITREEAMVDENGIFKYACVEGHLEFCKWLHETFQITKEEVMITNNNFFLTACIEGNLEIIKWLQKTFTFTKKEVSNYENNALTLAFLNKHFEVVYFLRDTYGFVKEDTKVFLHYIPEKDREKLFECLTPVGSFTKGVY